MTWGRFFETDMDGTQLMWSGRVKAPANDQCVTVLAREVSPQRSPKLTPQFCSSLFSTQPVRAGAKPNAVGRTVVRAG